MARDPTPHPCLEETEFRFRLDAPLEGFESISRLEPVFEFQVRACPSGGGVKMDDKVWRE